MRITILSLVLGNGLLLGLPLHAQTVENWCSAEHFHSDGMVSHAEVREERLASSSENYIHPGMNGSIKVHGWDSGDVKVEACVQAAAESASEAAALAQQVKITDGPGRIVAKGPETHDHSWWSVSYEVWVPRSSNVKLETSNGSVSVEGLRAQIHAETLNGSVKLSDVRGDIDSASTNGSVTVTVAAGGWNGGSMRLKTTNGTIRLNLPDNFSAHVEASTVNGKVHTDFPVTVSGTISNNLSFVLGSGAGPSIEARTVNGSVHIGRT